MQENLGLTEVSSLEDLNAALEDLTVTTSADGDLTLEFVSSANCYRIGYADSRSYSLGNCYTLVRGLDRCGRPYLTNGSTMAGYFEVSLEHLDAGNMRMQVTLDNSLNRARLDIGNQSFLVDPQMLRAALATSVAPPVEVAPVEPIVPEPVVTEPIVTGPIVHGPTVTDPAPSGSGSEYNPAPITAAATQAEAIQKYFADLGATLPSENNAAYYPIVPTSDNPQIVFGDNQGSALIEYLDLPVQFIEDTANILPLYVPPQISSSDDPFAAVTPSEGSDQSNAGSFVFPRWDNQGFGLLRLEASSILPPSVLEAYRGALGEGSNEPLLINEPIAIASDSNNVEAYVAQDGRIVFHYKNFHYETPGDPSSRVEQPAYRVFDPLIGLNSLVGVSSSNDPSEEDFRRQIHALWYSGNVEHEDREDQMTLFLGSDWKFDPTSPTLFAPIDPQSPQ